MQPGTRLGPYEILSPIGAGGMGEVYKARDTRLDRMVAVKVLGAHLGEDKAAMARFAREAKAVAALSHPNILAIHDFGTHEGSPYAVMELLEGETLRERLAKGSLPLPKATELAGQVARGLAAAHAKGIVHRDLKPANIFITSDGQAKILDFGLAKQEAKRSSGVQASSDDATADITTRAGMIVGTVGYMSPEQVRGLPADARSDIFAFGVVLYEMLAGGKPFQGDTPSDTLAALLMKDPDPLPPITPPGLDRIARQCLEKSPEKRFSSAQDVVQALEIASTSDGSQILRPQREGWLRRHWIVSTAAAAAIVLLAALLALDAGGFRSRWLSTGSGTASIRAIAVLPLSNVSGDPDQEFFSDGMTEELITHLSKISALKVISRTSVMRYKGSKKSLKEIAQELGVDGVIEGSVLRSGDKVRITAQLIDASTDTHLWAESYERNLKDILALQGEVARTIAGAVNVALTPQEKVRLSGARQVNPEAYEAYLKGMVNWQKMTPQGVEAAKGYFDRALEIDPSYAQAYQGLVWYWGIRRMIGLSTAAEAGPQAKAAALKAIGLDDSSAEAHEALAVVKWGTDWDWAGSEKEWRRTLELNPNSANAHAYYAHFLIIVGRTDEAVPHSERAIELDPLNALYHGAYAMVLMYDRRYDDALAAAGKALAIQPDMPVALTVIQMVYITKGMREEQLADQRQRIAKDPERLAALEKGMAEGGYEGAQLAIADLWAARYEKTGGLPMAGQALIRPTAIALRYLDGKVYYKAIDWLEKAYDTRDPNLPYFMAAPTFETLRPDPRFQALARKMSLPIEAMR